MAVENDVHVLGVSSLAGGHKTLVPEVIAELKKLGREDILVVVRRRHPAAGLRLRSIEAGVTEVFGPGLGHPGLRPEDPGGADGLARVTHRPRAASASVAAGAGSRRSSTSRGAARAIAPSSPAPSR